MSNDESNKKENGSGDTARADNENANEQDSSDNVVNMNGGQNGDAPNAGEGLSAEEHVKRLEAELAEARDRTMRALADAENTRRRAMKDRDDGAKYAIAKFAKDLLDFSDNFSRALGAIPDDLKDVDPRIASVLEGIEAMQRDLNGVFERNGVQKIEPIDQPFDAHYHEVMFEAPMPGKEAGIIIQVVEPGYVLNERLLRAAKVGIAKGGDGASPRDPGGKIDQQA
jgi:molecular chaperone GrpE